jgi:hypothetical protein
MFAADLKRHAYFQSNESLGNIIGHKGELSDADTQHAVTPERAQRKKKIRTC